VLFLILAFFNAAGLFLLLGAEFLAMILVVVYVGAVAVLFLFVVMMLDVDFVGAPRQGFLQVPASVGALDRPRPSRRARSLVLGDRGHRRRREPGRACRARSRCLERVSPTPRRSVGCSTPSTSTSSRRAGLILLVAMIGAIVLTLRHKEGVQAASRSFGAERPHQGDGDRGRYAGAWAIDHSGPGAAAMKNGLDRKDGEQPEDPSNVVSFARARAAEKARRAAPRWAAANTVRDDGDKARITRGQWIVGGLFMLLDDRRGYRSGQAFVKGAGIASGLGIG
jgi:NADH-quinone oxidoreductase subunit J